VRSTSSRLTPWCRDRIRLDGGTRARFTSVAPGVASVAVTERLGPVGEAVRGNGYAALTPGWPDDPETVEEVKAHPQVFAGKSMGQVADISRRSSAAWTGSRP
jgi:hypothetical protein